MERLMIIGLGPHAKRIYFNYLKKHNMSLEILVDLDSNKEKTLAYLNEVGFINTLIWTLPDKYKDDEFLPDKYASELKKICQEKKITHMIISTEPKAHNMYLNFALDNNINVLSDKPITVLKNMHELDNIQKIRKQYYDLLKKYQHANCECKIMCQRKYHKGYIYIKKILRDIILKYNVPITYIDIYHCDGNWEMPHDLDKENHPYKYGYGKLYHSGYHFIDLLAELIELNNLTTKDKRITKGTIYANAFTPNDEKVVINKNDYLNIFKGDKINGVYDNLEKIDFHDYGEKNFYSQLNFTNSNNALITTVNLNLLHYGFSRRGWFTSRDYYKSNGRIRHERVNIQVGPLLNIQIHSYQAKEIKDRKNSKEEITVGGLEHFDIYVFRNTDIIGGKPCEVIHLKDLYDDKILKNSFIGYNEYSREELITSFLKGNSDIGDLSHHKLGIEILYSATKTIYDIVNHKKPIERIKIPKNN